MSARSALSHFFIPKESNRNRARILHWEIVTLVVVVLFFSNKFLRQVPAPEILGYASQISTSDVIKLTNLKRTQEGLGTVTENSLLDKAAAQKASDMFAKGYWAHVAPDGTQPWDFFKDVGYRYRYAGENLARDFSSSGAAVDAWMASPSHRENMLNPKYKDIGVAVLDGNLNGHDATIIVQLFGTNVADRPQVPLAAAKEGNATKSATASVTAEVKPAETEKAPEVSVTQIPPPQLTVNSTPLLSDFNMSKLLSLCVIVVLLIALAIDGLVAWRKGAVRKSSRSIAQIAFLCMIFAIILIAKFGEII